VQEVVRTSCAKDASFHHPLLALSGIDAMTKVSAKAFLVQSIH
jgi:hypothetical protein